MGDLGFFAPQAGDEMQVDEQLPVPSPPAAVELDEMEEKEELNVAYLLEQKNYRKLKNSGSLHKLPLINGPIDELWEEYEKKKDLDLMVVMAALSFPPFANQRILVLLEDAIKHLSSEFKFIDGEILLAFLIRIYASLEVSWLRQDASKYCSIASWTSLTEERREIELEKAEEREKLWLKYQKKISKLKAERVELERSFLSHLIKVFVNAVETYPNDKSAELFCMRFLEFMIDLESQLPTRRFVHVLLLDHNVMPSLLYSKMLEIQSPDSTFRRLMKRLEFYIQFQIDGVSGISLSRSEVDTMHHTSIAQIQKACFVSHPNELEDFIYASIGSLVNEKSLLHHLERMSDEMLIEFGKIAGVRVKSLTDIPSSREFLQRCIAYALKKQPDQLDSINGQSLFPDEDSVFDDGFLSNLYSICPLPKLNIQFLTLHDYLLRNFELFKLESSYTIRQDIEDAILRLGPQFNPDNSGIFDRTVFQGWSRMATPINQLQIDQVGAPRLTETCPSFVKVDINYNLDSYRSHILDEWDTIRPHDSVFLVSVQMMPHSNDSKDFRKRYGITHIRGCEVYQILGDDGEPCFDFESGKIMDSNGNQRISSGSRTIRCLLDPNHYQKDLKAVKDVYDIYGSMNIIMRRKAGQNNFKSILETIRDLMQSELVVPEWFQDLLLGYGRRDSCHYSKMSNPSTDIDFGYTFLNWNHLVQSFPDKQVTPIKDKRSPDLIPPYCLQFPESEFEAFENDDSNSKKRKGVDADSILVKSYRFKSLVDKPKVNKIPFTPAQVRAIRSGSSTGLSLIVGPPGTGKTDVAVQIISNLYKQNPNCHMLLITRSNQALNHLFEKISQTNINPRHLLRLGQGHEDMDTKEQWGKAGRINSFLELRNSLLGKITELAASLEHSKEHGSSCETASYYFSTHIQPIWFEFKSNVLQKNPDLQTIVKKFPFSNFLTKIYPELFSKSVNEQDAADQCEEFYGYVSELFRELEEVRPFELLRVNKERANYLLVKEARIIAMTSTHASLKRRELVKLGFKYDTVIMEEAGQMLEVETFIPLLLQSHDTDLNASPLSRVVLIGDHNQLPPIVQNRTLSRYSNFEQSLLARMIRLQVPVIDLDFQGRARGSICDLYRWRYNNLKDLPLSDEFGKANAGFAYDFQAINVDDFNGVGETFPRPHYVQNLGEAEYCVATYMYMRLLGYPKEKIVILTTYNGQKDLIRDVLNKRCRFNPQFGVPTVSTVDNFQGQEADYVLLSLVRTAHIGHIRDIRRVIVALSRAKLGLYVFFRRKLFESQGEPQAFKKLFSRPSNLILCSGEEFGKCDRKVTETVQKYEEVFSMKEMAKKVHTMAK